MSTSKIEHLAEVSGGQVHGWVAPCVGCILSRLCWSRGLQLTGVLCVQQPDLVVEHISTLGRTCRRPSSICQPGMRTFALVFSCTHFWLSSFSTSALWSLGLKPVRIPPAMTFYWTPTHCKVSLQMSALQSRFRCLELSVNNHTSIPFKKDFKVCLAFQVF